MVSLGGKRGHPIAEKSEVEIADPRSQLAWPLPIDWSTNKVSAKQSHYFGQALESMTVIGFQSLFGTDWRRVQDLVIARSLLRQHSNYFPP